MKIKRLQVEGYKNIRTCDVQFQQTSLINAVIGINGSGKSNLIEAIIQILIGIYFKKPPLFNFRFEFDAQNRRVVLQREGKNSSVTVDDQRVALDRFADRLRDGPAQVFYPELTLVYYSGECHRVQKLVAKYRRHFQKLTRNPETDNFRPLFLQSSNEQSQVILLSLFAHNHRSLLDRLLLDEIVDVSIEINSPDGYDPNKHEPKLWNTVGAIRRIVAALDETSSDQSTHKPMALLEEGPAGIPIPATWDTNKEDRIYHFNKPKSLTNLAQRLEASGDNLYLALESLRTRGMLRRVFFQLKGRNSAGKFPFEQLSEGEKQLLAVVGALTLTNQKDNLILLDEPDTHLNPHWSWDYQSMLIEALEFHQQRSSVIMATHDPVMISGMLKEQVLLAHRAVQGEQQFSNPRRNPRGQGVANILCSKEFFGLPSSLDKESQKLLDERLELIVKEELTQNDKARLKQINNQLEILPGVSERDPNYVAFLRERQQAGML